MDAELQAMLNQTVRWKTVTAAASSSAAETLSSLNTAAAYWEPVTKNVNLPPNTDRAVNHLCITEAAIPEDARVWIPGADDTNTDQAKRPVFIRVMLEPESSTVSHYEVYL